MEIDFDELGGFVSKVQHKLERDLLRQSDGTGMFLIGQACRCRVEEYHGGASDHARIHELTLGELGSVPGCAQAPSVTVPSRSKQHVTLALHRLPWNLYAFWARSRVR